MRIFITGGEGKLGSLTAQALIARGHTVTTTDVATLDITDFHAVARAIKADAPDLVINSAAWTDVEGCAKDPDRAMRINGIAAGNVAQAAARAGAPIIHISTNEVFDGNASQRPYTEYDRPNPINPYGYSKWVGEQAVREGNPRHSIVRTAWLFAHNGKNFVQSILNAANAGKPLRVVIDEIANPTYTNDLAEAIAVLAEQDRYGTYHLVNEGACSRYAFARYVLDRAGHADTPITPITRHEWQRASTPPPSCALANNAAAMLGIRLRTWQAAVDAFFNHTAP